MSEIILTAPNIAHGLKMSQKIPLKTGGQWEPRI